MSMIDYHFAPDTGVAEVVLNNPRARNAVGPEDLAELKDTLDKAAQDNPRALVLRGEGKGFSAGRNIKGLNPREDDATEFLAGAVTPVLHAIDDFPAPTFALVHGACLGVGLGLALACDVVYVADDALFGSPFANLGATLDSGGHALFVERLGVHRAMDLIITGDLISGADAVAAGLFSRAVPADELLEFGRTKAAAAAQGATQAFLASRALVASIRDERTGFWDSVDAENQAQGRLCDTEDYYEGFAAFNEKRQPEFKGA